MQRTGRSFKETINQAVRVGLSSPQHRPQVPFRIEARALGLRAGLSYDSIPELIERAEGELAL